MARGLRGSRYRFCFGTLGVHVAFLPQFPKGVNVLYYQAAGRPVGEQVMRFSRKLAAAKAICLSAVSISAFACGAPAHATTMLATWQGVIVSGSVSSQSGGLVDGLSQGDYSGQAFTASFLYDTTVQSDQMYYSDATSSYLYGGAGFGANPVLDAYIVVAGVKIDLLAPSGLVQQQVGPNGLIEQQSDNSWNTMSFQGGGVQFENFYRGLTLGGYGDFPTALDFGLGGTTNTYSVNFDPSTPGFGTASDCDVITSYGGSNPGTSTPHCLSFSLRPDSFSVVDPPLGVPEPAQWALFLTGFGLAGMMLRLRRKQPSALAA